MKLIYSKYNILEEYIYISNNRKLPQSIGPKPVSTDNRLKNEAFTEDVKLVLIHLGLEPTKGNFRKYDRMTAWQEFAARIRNPVFTAKCYILWGRYHRDKWASSDDRRIYCEGKAQTVCVELKGKDRQSALSNLDSECYEFIEWWD